MTAKPKPHPLHFESINKSRINLDEAKRHFLDLFFDGAQRLKQECRRINYDDGGEYTGEYSEFREGNGMFKFPNRDIYMGSWKMDKFEGEGLYEYAHGDRYHGKFANGEKSGHGVYFYKSGARY